MPEFTTCTPKVVGSSLLVIMSGLPPNMSLCDFHCSLGDSAPDTLCELFEFCGLLNQVIDEYQNAFIALDTAVYALSEARDAFQMFLATPITVLDLFDFDDHYKRFRRALISFSFCQLDTMVLFVHRFELLAHLVGLHNWGELLSVTWLGEEEMVLLAHILQW